MYPSPQEFEELLNTRDLDWIIDTHLFDGVPFCFEDNLRTYNQMLRAIAKGLGIPKDDICIVGSGRIGFSLSPLKYGEKFNRRSDLDIVVVSPELFDPSWFNILANSRIRWSALRRDTQESLKDHREQHHIHNGWIYPHSVVEALDIGQAWLNTFNGLSVIPDLSTRKVGSRLYRSWQHARIYHRRSLDQVKKELDNTSRGG